MFVGTRNEADFTAIQTLKPGNRVSCNSLIGVADMWLSIGISDGSGDVERLGHEYS